MPSTKALPLSLSRSFRLILKFTCFLVFTSSLTAFFINDILSSTLGTLLGSVSIYSSNIKEHPNPEIENNKQRFDTVRTTHPTVNCPNYTKYSPYKPYTLQYMQT